MNIRKNAHATPHSQLMVRRVIDAQQPRRKVAADFGVSVETVAKWVRRWRAGGEPALNDRSSAPAHSPHRLPLERVAEIERLRRQRMSSPAIARQLGIPISTVTNVLRRLGLNRLKALEPPQPILRYERERPGELLHLDTKKLGRIGGLGHRITGRRTGVINRHLGIGWEYLHVCVDDASRLAYPGRRTQGERCRLPRPGPRLVRLPWRQRRAGHDRQRQLLPQPPLPPSLRRRRHPTPAHKALYATDQWKAERFIQTVLRECAYGPPLPLGRGGRVGRHDNWSPGDNKNWLPLRRRRGDVSDRRLSFPGDDGGGRADGDAGGCGGDAAAGRAGLGIEADRGRVGV